MKEFSQRAGKMIDGIRINAISSEIRDGREVLVKRRRAGSGAIIFFANRFFRAAQTFAFAFANRQRWQRWEVDCFNLLNNDQFRADILNGHAIMTERIPGKSLAAHFDEGTFDEAMLDFAADELRRAHALHYSGFDDRWSHGDANLANFLYDPDVPRCRLIDFELIHSPSLTANERHARDLLTFLQDLAGCINEERWIPAAKRFLHRYNRPELTPILKNMLVAPHGIPTLWWWIRTNYTPRWREKIALLREAI